MGDVKKRGKKETKSDKKINIAQVLYYIVRVVRGGEYGGSKLVDK